MARSIEKKATAERTVPRKTKVDDGESARLAYLTMKGSDDEDDDDDDVLPDAEDNDEKIPIKPPARQLPLKPNTILARTGDKELTLLWYEQTMNLKLEVCEYLYNEEELTRPSDWAKLTDKTIAQMVKGCRDNIRVSAIATIRMMALAFLCKHHIRIQRPLAFLSDITEDMIADIEQQKTIEDQYYDQKSASDPASLPLSDDHVAKSISTVQSLLAEQ